MPLQPIQPKPEITSEIKGNHLQKSSRYRFTAILFMAVCFGSFLISSCTYSSGSETKATIAKKQKPEATMLRQENAFPKSIGQIPLPTGFERPHLQNNEFGNFLSGLSLKEKGSPVKLYNGENKWNQNAHYAVVNLPIGTKDLHQCADAVMRVRADFLRQEKRFKEINFHFVSGFNCEYSKWMTGNRVKVNGNKVSWYAGGSQGDSDESYWRYLETVWSYASTLSLEKELASKAVTNIETGDVWIKGGSPGHAILVADVIENAAGKKLFLLAQSYMPAQELQVLKNPENSGLSPWYEIPTNRLVTPEWTFELNQLREWQ